MKEEELIQKLTSSEMEIEGMLAQLLVNLAQNNLNLFRLVIVASRTSSSRLRITDKEAEKLGVLAEKRMVGSYGLQSTCLGSIRALLEEDAESIDSTIKRIEEDEPPLFGKLVDLVSEMPNAESFFLAEIAPELVAHKLAWVTGIGVYKLHILTYNLVSAKISARRTV